MRRACGQACCWGGAAAVAPVRVCTKVMAPAARARGKTGKMLVFDAMMLYILLEVLCKTGVVLVRIAPLPPPRASRGLRRLACKASGRNDFCLKRASLSLSVRACMGARVAQVHVWFSGRRR